MNQLLQVETRERPGRQKARTGQRGGAFTLIELLVVIAIIGILAGLLIPLAGVATTKMRIARVKAELNSYVNSIETYKLETGEYPPDNGLMKNSKTNTPLERDEYKLRAGLNPLFYELTGATFANAGASGQFTNLHTREVIPSQSLQQAFDVVGLRNSARLKNDIDYKGFTLKNSQFAEVSPSKVQGVQGIDILIVPVPGPFQIDGAVKKKLNPWFYDASSTNRHNKSGFDLWAEIDVGGRTQVIANWKN